MYKNVRKAVIVVRKTAREIVETATLPLSLKAVSIFRVVSQLKIAVQKPICHVVVARKVGTIAIATETWSVDTAKILSITKPELPSESLRDRSIKRKETQKLQLYLQKQQMLVWTQTNFNHRAEIVVGTLH